MHWLISKFLAEKYNNKFLTFLSYANDFLAYSLFKIKRVGKNVWVVNGTEFAYRRQITVTEQSGNNLSYYQILIGLNSTNFDFSHANSDGSDVRFHDGSSFLDYWIEKWDSINQEAKIWVEVPSIPASGNTNFYMYYGNSDLTSASDGFATFDIFDDFEDGNLNEWVLSTEKDANGDYAIVTDSYEGSYAIKQMYEYMDIYARRDDLTITGGYAIDTYGKLDDSGTAGYWGMIAFFNNNLEGYAIDMDTLTKIAIMRIEGSGSTVPFGAKLVETSANFSANQWYWFTLAWLQDGQTFKIFTEDNSGKVTLEATDTTYTNLKTGYQSYAYIIGDLFKVRKYVEPEPSVSIGNEETP